MLQLTPLQQRTLQVAKRFVGQREATGHNDGWLPLLVQRFVAGGAKWLDRQPWCACFATYCIHKAAKELGQKCTVPKNASSSSLFRWFRERKLIRSAPVPGCIGLLKGGPTGHHHTFLVHAIAGDRVVGIDGNWRNAVCWTHHPISQCDFGPIF